MRKKNIHEYLKLLVYFDKIKFWSGKSRKWKNIFLLLTN